MKRFVMHGKRQHQDTRQPQTGMPLSSALSPLPTHSHSANKQTHHSPLPQFGVRADNGMSSMAQTPSCSGGTGAAPPRRVSPPPRADVGVDDRGPPLPVPAGSLEGPHTDAAPPAPRVRGDRASGDDRFKMSKSLLYASLRRGYTIVGRRTASAGASASASSSGSCPSSTLSMCSPAG